MRLISAYISNFRCLKEVSFNLDELTVLIGENDAGKSTVLNALDIALNSTAPDRRDYYTLTPEDIEEADHIITTEIQIDLKFQLDTWDLEGPVDIKSRDGYFYLRRVFTQNSNKTFYKTERYLDERLNQKFELLNVPDLTVLIEQLGIKSVGQLNQDKRRELMREYVKIQKKAEDWAEIKFKDLKDYLPRFQRYRAIDYSSPESFVAKTLQTVYESLIFEDQDGVRQPIQSLRELRVQVVKRVNEKVDELVEFVRPYNSRVRAIKMDPDIDFTKGFRPGEFMIDEGRGPHPLSRVGDGTKRRILMGTLDWDRATIQANLRSQTIIRAYDEPDSNLYYAAQRKLFDSIVQTSRFDGEQDYRVQSIVCTHSLLMVDSAPATSIKMLTLGNEGQTEIAYLKTDGEADIEEFLHTMARELGITNTMLFYEHCYLLIEGETEENALPLLYRKIYGTSILDDGIRIINLHGHGAWLSLLQLLGKNRQHITTALLDSDAHDEFEKKFAEAGFDDETFKDRCFWIGNREFEDAFADEVLCECLNQHYTRMDKRNWAQEDLIDIRNVSKGGKKEKEKFSTQLGKLVNRDTLGGTNFSKSEFGHFLGTHCPVESIPSELRGVFEFARKISGTVPIAVDAININRAHE